MSKLESYQTRVAMRIFSTLWRWCTSPKAYSTQMRPFQYFSISNSPSHTSPRPLCHQELQWLEFFAGKAACTYAMRRAGYLSARFDKLYFDPACKRKRKSNWHDILTPAGFMSLGWILPEICLSVHVVDVANWPYETFSAQLSLAIVFILKGKKTDFLAWFGIKCSTWVSINQGTSMRSICSSVGDGRKPSVAEGNSMLERRIYVDPKSFEFRITYGALQFSRSPAKTTSRVPLGFLFARDGIFLTIQQSWFWKR